MDKKSLVTEGFELPKQKKVRAKFREAIAKFGLEKVLANPYKFLPLPKSRYSKSYLKRLPYFIRQKRNGTA